MAADDAVTLQFMSDLHLELFPGFRIAAADVQAPRLVLAGDTPGHRKFGNTETQCLFSYSLRILKWSV